MRIGLICPYNITKGGGVQEAVYAICDELEGRGHYVRIITPTPKSRENYNDHRVLFLGNAKDVKSFFHTTSQVSYNVSNESIDNLLNQNDFDILHFHEPWVPLLSRQILTRSHSINIATFHAKLPDTAVSRTIERVITPYTKPMMKYFDGLSAVSEAAAQYVRSITNKNVEIIPNGINTKLFQVNRQDSTKLNKILYIGRLEKRKGVKYLIDAFYELKQKKSDLKLIIAGDGPGRQKLETYVSDHNIKGVKFLGYVLPEKKIELLQTSDLFCSPALYGESFGIVLLEAMAAGLPLVAGNNIGYSELMTNEGSISIANPRDIVDFSRRLDLMLSSKPFRKIWRDWAKNEVVKYEYAKIVDAYEVFYGKIKRQKNSKDRS